MKRSILNIGFSLLLILYATGAGAQVLVRASVDRDSILIGQPIQLLLDVRAPLGTDILWFNLDTIPHFEFLQKGKVDTTEGVDGKKIQQLITLTSFDSGHWQLPRLLLKIANKTYATDSIGIGVGYTPFNADEDYRDIKSPVEVPSASTGHLPWIVGSITVLAIAAIVYLLMLRKKKVAEAAAAPVNKLTPFEEAIQALDQLQKKGWPQNGEIKEYYTKLNDILRVFVFRKLRISSLEKTNEELITQLRSKSIDKEPFEELANALRIADFVKFAKYQPTDADNEKNLSGIRKAIHTLNNIS